MSTQTLDYARQMPRELARSEAIAAAEQRPDRQAPLRAVAQSLSRRGVAAAKCELANGSILALVEMLFDADSDGYTPNVDADGWILPPVPWGRNGGRLWGLRATEQRTLNHILRHRSDEHGEPLFVYDSETRHWLLGRAYRSRRAATAYLHHYPVTLAEWRSWQVCRSTWARRNLGEE